jgi:hypothetical protein
MIKIGLSRTPPFRVLSVKVRGKKFIFTLFLLILLTGTASGGKSLPPIKIPFSRQNENCWEEPVKVDKSS